MAFFTPFTTTSATFSPAFSMFEDLSVPAFETLAFESEPVTYVGPFATASRPRRQNLRHSASHSIFSHNPYAYDSQQLAHQEYLRQRQQQMQQRQQQAKKLQQQQELQRQRQREEQQRLKLQRERQRELEMQRRKIQEERERLAKLAQEKKMMQKEHEAFQPKFDVRETADAYQLHGDLAGLNKKDVELEFVDAQTLVVRGRVVRDYGVARAEDKQEHEDDVEMEAEANKVEADAKAEAEAESKTETAAEADKQETARPASPTPSNYHKATVEDSPDEDDRFSITSMTLSSSSASSRAGSVAGEKRPATTATAAAATAAASGGAAGDAPAQKKTKTDHAKYLAQERTVGEFERVFRFPRMIRQEEVHASLEDGVLNVVVPKVRAEQRRVIWF